jgi:AcrR family transcriptional regulator
MVRLRPPIAPVNTALYGLVMSKRLTAQAWIDFALATLAHEGCDALKADLLARKLGVSRGSFYWHFRDLRAFHARVIAHWREMATEAIIADLDRYDSPEERLRVLLRRAFRHPAVLEIRMRIWAENSVEAARALRDIDNRRWQYIVRLLVEAGIAEPFATRRAQILYWAYLGAAWHGNRLSRGRLDRIVTELEAIGLRKFA